VSSAIGGQAWSDRWAARSADRRDPIGGQARSRGGVTAAQPRSASPSRWSGRSVAVPAADS